MYRLIYRTASADEVEFLLVAAIPRFSYHLRESPVRSETDLLFQAAVKFANANGGAFFRDAEENDEIYKSVQGCDDAMRRGYRCVEDDDGEWDCDDCRNLPYAMRDRDAAYA